MSTVLPLTLDRLEIPDDYHWKDIRARAGNVGTPSQGRADHAFQHTFRAFVDELGFARVATLEEIAVNGSNLSMPLYVKRVSAAPAPGADGADSLRAAWTRWQDGGRAFWQRMDTLVETLDGLLPREDADA